MFLGRETSDFSASVPEYRSDLLKHIDAEVIHNPGQGHGQGMCQDRWQGHGEDQGQEQEIGIGAGAETGRPVT